ncbi:DNA replication and repair protein RecF [Corallococcus coralloides]|uniref:DNA replication and repair protein RecF n=1 Tax=Corallococcus coralloides TaxID=184914 RepID=A0A410RLA5_CORCK|nr:AAA family ATPase [Corallococcus coralloides]QAT82712.1 DNA replication and repair protein RecF [Corallococcus coralloides]
MSAENRAITRIHVEGFRSLQNVDLEPGRVTVLIGANGAGKSNLLSLLRMVALMRTQSLRRYVGEAGGASALLHYGPKLTKALNIRLEFEQKTATNAYSARLGYAAGDTLLFLDEAVEHRRAGSDVTQLTSLGAGHKESILEEAAGEQGDPTAKAVRWWLSKTNFFHFHDTSFAAPLRQNSRQEDVRFLHSDGSNLAAYLRSLAISEEPARQAAWRRISQLVRRVAPFIKSLQPTLVDPANPETSSVRLDWVDERDQLFGPHHLSDGTLRCIALFTALGQPVDSLPAFLSIDEPELGLHPAALGILASLVRSTSTHAQILLATQSPALLDLFEPQEVVVTERAQGATTFRRLDPERLKGWLEDYSLSELYDKNVLGGRP